jgi:pyruvate dehydrogenase E1 component
MTGPRRALASRWPRPRERLFGCCGISCATRESAIGSYRYFRMRRTFGMDSFFPTAKIYNPRGQRYTSVDRALFLAYKESEHGQLLHVGINEAGSVAAFSAAGTSYSTHGEHMIPAYIFYSMFGFQRTGDFMWAAMDQMARGFIIGATAGRTTLTGEGLQHADGHLLILAATNPGMKVYDPAFA